MSAPQVIVYPRGQLTDADRDSLRIAGFCVVEADDPKAVVTHLPSAPMVTANEMLLCALQAMREHGSTSCNGMFTLRLLKAMEANKS